jgi:DNA modification methylase
MPSSDTLLPFTTISARAGEDEPPTYPEEALHLYEAEICLDRLSAIDWSFAEEATNFLGHDVHPYPAKFIPQLPGNLIARLSGRGEAVLDPFGGSGTTALEANRLGRRATSVDANPLAALIGRVKTTPLNRQSALELQGLHAALAGERTRLPQDPVAEIIRLSAHIPVIPNRAKWFAENALAELALIKERITRIESDLARDIALVALSRMVIWASFQDSETRYKSVPREVARGSVLARYLRELSSLYSSLTLDRQLCRFGRPNFITGDARKLGDCQLGDGSFDLIVTSPPYGNATDYHLYHRFRLLWLGFSPIDLGRQEIGSHLKHQREASGFDAYAGDIEAALAEICRVLKSGRYAALVLGSSIYKGEAFDVAEQLGSDAARMGFDAARVIRRPLPANRRSFGPAARRATDESILVLRKRTRSSMLVLKPPPYRLWPYEAELRVREARQLLGCEPTRDGADLKVEVCPARAVRARDLVFTHLVSADGAPPAPTWQAVLENGGASDSASRKDPKYATHGLHPYKGKFYPQLARSLMNMAGIPAGATVLDPFCGSGTTLLEASLNGMRPFGCDMHPLAAQIARVKTDVLLVEPDLLRETVSAVLGILESIPNPLPDFRDDFPENCRDEINRWFSESVIRKLAWLLRAIRRHAGGVVRDFLEVVLSGIIREISHQEPTDLRIRYRAVKLNDANVFGLFKGRLIEQFGRIEKFWSAYPAAPHALGRANVALGDNRSSHTFHSLGLDTGSVDAVITSPPYATALPYIDTDRLSLLVLHNLSSAERRPIEWGLTGSREISNGDRRTFEEAAHELPTGCSSFLTDIRAALEKDDDAGFRKKNQPALLTRYLRDMAAAMTNLAGFCRQGADCMIVIGDNRTELGGQAFRIPTTDLVQEIGVNSGFTLVERLPITVTTDNHLHIKNAITENAVLWLRRGS